MEIIKEIVRVGNSAGVILPKDWYGGKARVELIEKPHDVKKEILELLDEYLSHVTGIYLTGSYARGEETRESDIDIVGITHNINATIKKGKYDIVLISKEKVEQLLENNCIPLLPWLKEAKPIVNKQLIEEYKKTPLTKKNLKWHIESTKSAIKTNKEHIRLSEILSEKNVSEAVAYSLVLRLRGIYIVDCLIKGKLWNNKELISLIKKIAGSDKAYEGYIYVKNDISEKSLNVLPILESKKLLDYIKQEIEKQETWVKEKKD